MLAVGISIWLLLIGALVCGQAKVVRSNWQDKRAGWVRLTFDRASSPIKFYVMSLLDITLLVAAMMYFVGLIAALVA